MHILGRAISTTGRIVRPQKYTIKAEQPSTVLSARPTRPRVCIRHARGNHMPGIHSRIVLVRVVVPTMSTTRTRGILGLRVLLLPRSRGAEGYLRGSPLLQLFRSRLVWRLGALLGVLRGRWDGEYWRDGGIGGCEGMWVRQHCEYWGQNQSQHQRWRKCVVYASRPYLWHNCEWHRRLGFTFVVLDTASEWVATGREAAE